MYIQPENKGCGRGIAVILWLCFSVQSIVICISISKTFLIAYQVEVRKMGVAGT